MKASKHSKTEGCVWNGCGRGPVYGVHPTFYCLFHARLTWDPEFRERTLPKIEFIESQCPVKMGNEEQAVEVYNSNYCPIGELDHSPPEGFGQAPSATIAAIPVYDTLVVDRIVGHVLVPIEYQRSVSDADWYFNDQQDDDDLECDSASDQSDDAKQDEEHSPYRILPASDVFAAATASNNMKFKARRHAYDPSVAKGGYCQIQVYMSDYLRALETKKKGKKAEVCAESIYDEIEIPWLGETYYMSQPNYCGMPDDRCELEIGGGETMDVWAFDAICADKVGGWKQHSKYGTVGKIYSIGKVDVYLTLDAYMQAMMESRAVSTPEKGEYGFFEWAH